MSSSRFSMTDVKKGALRRRERLVQTWFERLNRTLDRVAKGTSKTPY